METYVVLNLILTSEKNLSSDRYKHCESQTPEVYHGREHHRKLTDSIDTKPVLIISSTFLIHAKSPQLPETNLNMHPYKMLQKNIQTKQGRASLVFYIAEI